MISSAGGNGIAAGGDRLLIVGGEAMSRAWSGAVDRAYEQLAVKRCDSYLSAIAEVCRTPVRAVLAHVDPQVTHLEEAVSGLREAAGRSAKLVLCCKPAHEPMARRLVQNVADEYLLLPFRREELDRAIGYGRAAGKALDVDPPHVSLEELSLWGDLLSIIDSAPSELLQRLAALVRSALGARGVTVIVEGAVATSGDVVVHPVLTAPLTSGDRVIGQLTLAAGVDGAYTPGDAEKLRHFATVASSVLMLASEHRRLRTLADTDECSGLPNRRSLRAKLDQILDAARHQRFPVTVLVFDIDNFKECNDLLGHDAGDRMLRRVGQVFRQHCRQQDVVARWGGDEFVVVFWDADGPRTPGSAHPDSALVVLDRVRDALKREPLDEVMGEGAAARVKGSSVEKRPSLRLTISGGLATYPWDASTRDELICHADEALLAAKRAGKNRVYLFGDPATR